MSSNRFGTIFTITTWGESHGRAIGVVIDGCPAGIALSDDDINDELKRRRGGQSPYTTPRSENDCARIYSGVFEGKTTGAPISIIIENGDVDSSKYKDLKDLYRPGHANFTYLEKYGIFDHRGGGRSSARETACRVAAGAVARKLLKGVTITARLCEIGSIPIAENCTPDQFPEKVKQALESAIADGDSLGAIIECTVENLSVGLGDPIYEKLEANLAKAMLSIPATKGFDIGSGFEASRMRGPAHNDSFVLDEKENATNETNHAGGTLGGISTGTPLTFRVAFKPTSSIKKTQKTVNTSK